MASLPASERTVLMASLTDDELSAYLFDWPFWARPAQLTPPGEWYTWIVLAGRGFGKTRTGAEFVRQEVEAGRAGRIALVASTAADARDTMVEGESGILATSPTWNYPHYEPSKRRVTWPNGARATLFSADEPKRLRGPQHDFHWSDEVCFWQYIAAWDNLMLGLRLGNYPRGCVTTTPKPSQLLRKILYLCNGEGQMLRDDNNRPVPNPTTVRTGGSTYENIGNLAPVFVQQVIRPYEGTRQGRQELHAEILEDMPGALWTYKTLDRTRITEIPDLYRIVIAVDPAETAKDGSNETGIIACGLGKVDGEPHGYVFDDVSEKYTPSEWAHAIITLLKKWKADAVVVEVNAGGDMIAHTIHTVDRKARIIEVRAKRGKYTRAEPVAALYENGRIHHVGAFPLLEDQLCNWVPGDDSPDRLDALVWGFSELFQLEDQPKPSKATTQPVRNVRSAIQGRF